MDSPWLLLLVQVILIGFNAIFACTEIAVVSFNTNKLEKLSSEGNKKAVKLSKVTAQPARFLATIQIAITLSGFLGSAFAAENFSDIIVEFLVDLGVKIPVGTLNTVSVVLITLILSYFTLIFGELVPKRVAMKNSEKVALGMANLIYFISKLFSPIVSLLTVSTNAVLKLLGIDPNSEDEEVSEEDIKMMVDAGHEKGTIDNDEKEFIQNVFEFDNITAGELATHRTEVSLLWLEETQEQWKNTIYDSRHTYYPICDETVDNVVGILNAKDYFRLEDRSRQSVMENAVKPAYFVPESVKADVLFKNMKSTKNTFAVVLDEYGGMIGIITMTDIIGQLVGDIDNENDDEEEEIPIKSIDSQTWKILGSADVKDVEEALNVSLSDEDEYDTFNGFVFGSLGSVPDDGSTFEFEAAGLSVKVTNIEDHQVVSALVCKTNPKMDISEEKTSEKR